MKKIIPILVLTISLTVSLETQKVSAFACANCSMWGIQIPQRLLEIVRNADTAANQFNTHKNMVKNTVTDPFSNILKNQALASVFNSAKNYTLSGGTGGAPTFLLNPEKYFNNVGTETIKINLGDLTKNGNMFTKSVIGSIIGKSRSDQASISDKTAPTIGTTIKNNVCSDDNLSRTALNDVSGGISVAKSSALDNPDIRVQYEARKQELYNYFSCGNSGKLTPEAEKKITTAYNGNFAVGGWSGWLDQTMNQKNNAHGNALLTNQIIADNTAVKTEAAKATVANGNGSIGTQKCVKTVDELGPDGNPTGKKLCESYETVTTGSIASKIAENAALGLNDAISKSQGDSVDSLVSLFKSSSNTFNSIVNSGITSALSVNLNSSSLNNLTDPSVSSNTVVTTSNSVGLISDAEKNSSPAMKEISNQLEDSKTEISKQASISTAYKGGFQAYKNNVDALGACYTAIETSYPNYLETPLTAGAFNFTNSSGGVYNNSGKIVSSLIADGRKYISSTTGRINNSLTKVEDNLTNMTTAQQIVDDLTTTFNSSNDITALKEANATYARQVHAGIIPEIGYSAVLKQEYQDIQSDSPDSIDTDVTDNLNPKTRECAAMKTAVHDACITANTAGSINYVMSNKSPSELCPSI